MNKKIANIVFYKFQDQIEEDIKQQACIFYEDGTFVITTYEEGLDAAYEVAAAEKLTWQQFQTALNKERFFMMSGAEFKRRAQEFVTLSPASVASAINAEMVNINPTKTEAQNKENSNSNILPESQNLSSNETEIFSSVEKERAKKERSEKERAEKERAEKEQAEKEQAEKEQAEKEQAEKEQAEKEKLSLWQRIKKSRICTKITALCVAATILISGGVGAYKLSKKNKAGPMVSNNISLQQVDGNGNEVQDAAYNKLLNKTKNEELKAIMTKQSQNLDMYNRDFAKNYLEPGKDVKAALTWDEVITLNLAYNDYTPEQIRLMFNGSNVNSLALSHAYKNAQLQLMGAYVISDRKNPVNMANFVNDEEGKKFVEKYESLFYDCKEATGDARVEAVNKFYKELFKDFPISDEVREVGLSHADGRKQVKNYMSAVAPMVAASEIMWQNLKIDHTLSDKATAYFNDIGLCNLAEDAFEKAETITLVAETNKKEPTYEEFKNTKIDELRFEDNDVIDDAHRDLSQLDAYQKWVNGHANLDQTENNYSTSSKQTTTNKTTKKETTYKTKTSTHTTSDRKEAVNAAGEEAVKKAEGAVNKKTEQENSEAKAKAEKEAEENRKKLQEEAEKEKEKLEDQAKEDFKDFLDKINDANDKINNGGSVNEDDLGHGVDFDDDHSDNNGNLNDNIGDITTDGDGAYDHNDPLPDPNETGKKFDQNGSSSANGSFNESTTTDNSFSEDIYSYEEPYINRSNEDIVNEMIRDMENQQGSAETAKVYTKK